MQFDLWIDTTEWVVLRREMRFAEEAVAISSACRRIRFRPGFEASDFQVRGPAGTETIQVGPPTAHGDGDMAFRYQSAAEVSAKAGMRVLQPDPATIPRGFRCEGHFVHPPSPGSVFRRRVTTRYVQGDQVISLNQGPMSPREWRDRDRQGEPREIKPGVFFWVKHNLRLVLIGPREADRDQLRRCAASVDWRDAR